MNFFKAQDVEKHFFSDLSLNLFSIKIFIFGKNIQACNMLKARGGQSFEAVQKE